MSLATLPLMGTAVVYGTIPAVDIALGIVLPLHIHLGFDTIIQDYIPERRNKVCCPPRDDAFLDLTLVEKMRGFLPISYPNQISILMAIHFLLSSFIFHPY